MKSKIIFLVILLLGSALRFNHILNVGPFIADTAWRLSETRFLIECFKWAKNNPRFQITEEDLNGRGSVSSFREFVVENNLENFIPTQAKPWLNFFIAFFNLVFHLPIEDAGNVMAAFFGLLVIVMAFLLGKAFYDADTGLISAAVAAVSSYQIMYSGRGFELSPVVFFVMLSTYFYCLSRREGQGLFFLSLTGLSAGIAYGMHTSLFVLAVLLLLYEIHLFLSHDRPALKKQVGRIGALALSALIPLLVAEAVYLYLRILTNYPHFTYFEQLLFRYRDQGDWSRSLDVGVLILPRSFLILEGNIVVLLLVVGMLSIVRIGLSKRQITLPDLIIFSQFLLPLIWWSTHYLHIPRLLLLSLSASPLVAARGGVALADLVSSNRTRKMRIIIALILAILAAGTYNSWGLITLKPGYEDAFRYMSSHKGDKHLSTLSYVSDVYYKGRFSPLIEGLSLSDVKRLVVDEGYKYLLVDWQKHHYLKHPQYRWLERIEEEMKPVCEISNPAGRYRPFLFENCYAYRGIDNQLRERIFKDPDMAVIKIYDLEEYFLPVGSQEKRK